MPVESLPKTVTIDATGKPLGRLASVVAQKLRGKDSVFYRKNIIAGSRVKVINLKQVVFSGKKMHQKLYYRHTGYIGHLKEERLSRLWQRKPHEVLRRAVSGMLPKNKLRAQMLKRLEIEL